MRAKEVARKDAGSNVLMQDCARSRSRSGIKNIEQSSEMVTATEVVTPRVPREAIAWTWADSVIGDADGGGEHVSPIRMAKKPAVASRPHRE